MADLTQELALLNQQAAELLQKYDQAFTRLDEKSQELAQQLVNQINDGLSQLQQKTNDGITQLVAKIQEGLNQLQTIIETGAFPKVVSKPTIIGSTTAAIGHETSWTVSAESYLDDNVHIDHFEINWGDGNTETVSATENQAQISHTFSGNVGDSFQISVVAVDSLGNKSEPATLKVQLVDNQPPDISGMQITGFSDSDGNPYLIGGYSKQISISGAEDPEGQNVFYDITDSGILVPSKTQNIADGELIDIQAPSVEQDTTTALEILAKDEIGVASPIKTFNVIVKKVGFGIADIFGDGSCVVYIPYSDTTATSDLVGHSTSVVKGSLSYYDDGNTTGVTFGNSTGLIKIDATASECRSLSMIVKVLQNTGNWIGIMGFMNASNLYTGYLWLNNPTAISNGSGATSTAISLNTWLHIALIFPDDNSMEVYINGSNKVTLTPVNPISNNDVIGIGDATTANHAEPIAFRNFRAFNRVLNDSEIQILAQEP